MLQVQREGRAQDALPEVVWIYQLDRANRLCRFESRFGDYAVDLPMDPMHGTVGVAPAFPPRARNQKPTRQGPLRPPTKSKYDPSG